MTDSDELVELELKRRGDRWTLAVDARRGGTFSGRFVADSPGEALEAAGRELDARDARRLTDLGRAQDGAPVEPAPERLGNGAAAEDVARVVEVLEDAGDWRTGPQIVLDALPERRTTTERLAELELALAQAVTDDVVETTLAGATRVWRIKR